MTEAKTNDTTRYTTCPLCEATCGLEIVTRGREILSIRGDTQDVFSHGHICPKAYSLKELHEDPDRLREPMVRQGDRWQKISWDEAFATVERGLAPILEQHGRDALAFRFGNPIAHNLAAILALPILLKAANTHSVFSASTLDQMSKQVATGLMFGTDISIPVPDLDRTDYLLLLGANPLVSNGSIMTAPDMRGRLRQLRKRGGKIVVIDPYRTRTAQEADEHHFIRPGSDPYFLFAIVHTLFAEGLVAPGRLTDHINGIEQVREVSEYFSPERVAPACGIAADTIRRITRELAVASRAVVYGRLGTCAQAFGTLTSWLVDVINILTGNLDREGGAMFPRAAAGGRNTTGLPGRGRGVQFGRWKSRVSGRPEVYGEFPDVCLAEEIETPGEGQVRALITLAANPVLSSPNSKRLQQALSTLDFMVSIDIYLNETTRHANVILPPPSPMERSHYDLLLYQLSVRNVAHYSPPVFERKEGALSEWEILLRLAAILMGQGAKADLHTMEDFIVTTLIQSEVAKPGSRIEGLDPGEIMAALQPRRGPERLLDFLLRTGPHRNSFAASEDLSLAKLEARPHGVDLGPLQPRIPEVLRTPSGKIEMAPSPIIEDVERLHHALERDIAVNSSGQMLLIGRRDLRSNNSWMHNLPVLMKGKDRSTLRMHPDDASRLHLSEGDLAQVASRTGTVEISVELTDDIMPSVVSIPHGWGHRLAGTGQHVAAEHAGVNVNILTDEAESDPLSGNAVLNGVPVTISRVRVATS